MIDPEKASTLVMAIMLGEEGTALLGSLSGQAVGKGASATQAWGTCCRRSMPRVSAPSGNEIQKAFLRNLLKRQGTALLGRALPFGIGAVVGGVGNLVMGRAVMANAKEAFGPMPDTIPGGTQSPLRSRGARRHRATTPRQQHLEGGNLGSER